MKYCSIDTESGGRQESCSLLTAAFVIFDEGLNQIIDSLHLFLKPDNDNPYILNAQGMAVNKIDIINHDKIAIPYKQAKTKLFDFLKRNDGGEHIIPIGHATKGDINRIIENLISEGSWHQFCTYHFIDTSVVLQFLRACGKMPLNCDGSVEALAQYFNINQKAGDDAQYHDALFDAKITAKIFKKMIERSNSVKLDFLPPTS